MSKLALSFALPASLFVSMTDIPRQLLLQQGRLVLALILSHAGLFVVAWFALGFLKSLHGTPAIVYALMLSTSATLYLAWPFLDLSWALPAPGAWDWWRWQST
ncbi:MAG TPA: hypothetical protein VN902_06390 [Candidatus Acidoferrales bacterium]|nr:hypothetical protein [Candidatus Acidoferrales bacterium]